MRRFEFVQGTSNKFWEVTVDGSSLTTSWGRIGTKGQSKTKSFDSPESAIQAQDKLVAEKLKEGYVEVGAAPVAPAASPSKRRFELADGRSNRFWEIVLFGNVIQLRWGETKRNAPPQESQETRCLASADEARTLHDQLVAGKLGEGFGEVESREPEKPKPPARKTRAKASASGGCTDLIERLDRWFSANRPKLYALIRRPGADPERIASAEKSLAFAMPQALRDLFAWQGGVEPGGPPYDQGAFYQQYGLMGLEDALSAKEDLDGMLERGDFKQQGWWNASWLPFLDRGNGDMLCLDMAGCDGPKGQMIDFCHDDALRVSHYPSVDGWLRLFVETIEAGHWEVDESGFFDLKADAFEAHREAERRVFGDRIK